MPALAKRTATFRTFLKCLAGVDDRLDLQHFGVSGAKKGESRSTRPPKSLNVADSVLAALTTCFRRALAIMGKLARSVTLGAMGPACVAVAEVNRPAGDLGANDAGAVRLELQ